MESIELLKLLDPAQLILLIYIFYRNSELEKKILKLEIMINHIKESI